MSVVSMRTLETRVSGSAEWHAHPFAELCLVADNGSRIGKVGSRVEARPGTLFLFPPRQRHGYWNGPRQSPRFWVLHFTVARESQRYFSFLREHGKRSGTWTLSPAQIICFKTYFLRIFREHVESRPLRAEAEYSWLQLLLVQMQRWITEPDLTLPIHDQLSPDLIRLWQLVNECVGRPDELARRLPVEVPNYDSVRHPFKKTFGCSPHAMLRKLRLQHAKNLLLETTLSIGEIADQLGYSRQHEFSRSFSRHTGCSPSQWRQNPGIGG